MGPETILVGPGLDEALAGVPTGAAIFLVWLRAGRPYLGRTSALRRRLKRLLGPRAQPSRMLHLRDAAVRVEYWVTGSRLSASLLHYELARQHFPRDYEEQVRLPSPAYVKVVANRFARTQVTTRLSGSALQFGPFRSRAVAEEFEQGMLDFFQVRRCQEELTPSSDHPGCIYGEMNRCLRPCQAVVGDEEYSSEAARLTAFLESRGESLVSSLSAARDRLSADLEFEEAARQQQRLTRVEAVLRLTGELAADIGGLHGVAVLPSAEPGRVELRFLLKGVWQQPREFLTEATSGEMIPMDRRVREMIAELPEVKVTVRERQEHLALLARWYYSSWRDGEWVGFPTTDRLPYRRVVNAIARQAKPGGDGQRL